MSVYSKNKALTDCTISGLCVHKITVTEHDVRINNVTDKFFVRPTLRKRIADWVRGLFKGLR